MTEAKKNTNYTPEMEAVMVVRYVPTATQDERTAAVADLAVELNRTTRSIIAKLTTMKLYVPKAYRTKTGAKPVRKEAIVRAIEGQIGCELDGLEKATKNALVAIFNALAASEVEAFNEETETEVEVSS
jgi:hypothetical protein